jgi:hypothetical protein
MEPFFVFFVFGKGFHDPFMVFVKRKGVTPRPAKNIIKKATGEGRLLAFREFIEFDGGEDERGDTIRPVFLSRQ